MQVHFVVTAVFAVAWVDGTLLSRIPIRVKTLSRALGVSYRYAHTDSQSTATPYASEVKSVTLPTQKLDEPKSSVTPVPTPWQPIDTIGTHYQVGLQVYAGKTTSIFEALDTRTLQAVTLMVNRIYFLQDPTEKLQDLDRIRKATQKVRDMATAKDQPLATEKSCSHANSILHILPDHRDHLAIEFYLGSTLWTVLEPMKLLSLKTYIRSIESLSLVMRELFLADILHSLITGVLQIHKTGFLHGDLQPGTTFIELQNGTPVVRLLNFQAIPIGHSSGNLRDEYSGMRTIIGKLMSIAPLTDETSPVLRDFATVALDCSIDFEKVKYHPFIQ